MRFSFSQPVDPVMFLRAAIALAAIISVTLIIVLLAVQKLDDNTSMVEIARKCADSQGQFVRRYSDGWHYECIR